MIDVMRHYTSSHVMQAVVLFARSPEREAAAKRMPWAAPLFRDVIGAWLASAAAAGAAPLIACAAADRGSLARIAPGVERGWIEQSSGTFAERVCAAMAAAFARGYGSVIIAAIDAPPPRQLRAALSALAEGRPVVAPARDGGVNFIGLTAPDRTLLSQFSLHRRDLVRVCVARLPRLVVFAASTDLDSPSALAAARRERAWLPFVLPFSFLTPQAGAPALRGFTPARFSRPPP